MHKVELIQPVFRAEIRIPIVNDDEYEKNEDFFIELGEPVWHREIGDKVFFRSMTRSNSWIIYRCFFFSFRMRASKVDRYFR